MRHWRPVPTCRRTDSILIPFLVTPIRGDLLFLKMLYPDWSTARLEEAVARVRGCLDAEDDCAMIVPLLRRGRSSVVIKRSPGMPVPVAGPGSIPRPGYARRGALRVAPTIGRKPTKREARPDP